MKTLVLLVAFMMPWCVTEAATKARLPGDAEKYMALLGKTITELWATLERRAFPAGVIEQESNWRVSAKLQKPRETGVGLGQFTKAYNADGSVRFDALEETKRLDPLLAGWSWKDPYDAAYQIRGVVVKLRVNDRKCSALLSGIDEVLACDAAAYNGGLGSIDKRIRLCQTTTNCNPEKWFGNLELMTVQSTKKVKGYGESFAETNSKYPARVFARMPKYNGWL